MGIFKKSNFDPSLMNSLAAGVYAVGVGGLGITALIMQRLEHIRKEKEQAERDLEEIELTIKKYKRDLDLLKPNQDHEDDLRMSNSKSFKKFSFEPNEIIQSGVGVAAASAIIALYRHIMHLIKTRNERIKQLERLNKLEEYLRNELEKDQIPNDDQ
jgi:hypothetical protein